MSGKKAFVALAVTTALAVLGISSALGRPAARTRANAVDLCSLAAWTVSIRSIPPISSATPLSPDHMVLSARGTALGT